MTMIQLKSSDHKIFKIREEFANGSQTIKHMIEDGCADSTIPLANVSSKILAKVIEYLKKHAVAAANAAAAATSSGNKEEDEAALAAYDREFVKVDQKTLFDLILAANYLDIQSLLDLTCKTAADLMKGKMVEEIREMLNITNDFTPDEEEEIRKENEWAFE